MTTYNVLYEHKVIGQIEAENPVAAHIAIMNLVSTEEIVYED